MVSVADAEPLRVAALARLRAAGCVFAEEEFDLLRSETPDLPALASAVDRRSAGQPVEWVLGFAAFAGLRVPVHAGVFVPRPRTELMARLAVDRLAPGHRVLDLGCGAGALALVMAVTRWPRLVVACDVDPRAVANARETLAGWQARVVVSDLFDALPADERYDVITANLPYVPTDAWAYLPLDARAHEPRFALDGGADGLEPLRRCTVSLPGRLTRGGCLLTEVNEEQETAARRVLQAAGLEVAIEREERTRVLVARAQA